MCDTCNDRKRLTDRVDTLADAVVDFEYDRTNECGEYFADVTGAECRTHYANVAALAEAEAEVDAFDRNTKRFAPDGALCDDARATAGIFGEYEF